MGTFFIYILKSAVCLVLFYLFFKLLLSKETFHRFNRVALLGVLLLSLLIPCIEVTTRHQVEVQQAVLSVEQLLMTAEMENAVPVEVEEWQEAPAPVSLSWVRIVLLVYLAGIVILVCRNVYSLLCLIRLICSGEREKLENGITLVVHDRKIAPFSWMKYIVISRKDMEENGREILIHEAAHIRNYHSVDLLIADICIFFQWFNPGAWLLKQELQNIHEYEADETVINEGVNAKEYQLLLIKKAVGTRLYSMVNSFNHSKLKKRITMMLKEKSNPWARLKYLYVLPLAAIAVTAFARPEISEKAEEISAVKVNDLADFMQENVLGDTVKMSKSERKENIGIGGRVSEDNEVVVFEVVEQMPEYPGGMDALRQYLKDQTESSSVRGKAGGSVIVGFTVTENGKVKDVKASQSDPSILSKEAERIVREMPDWKPGKQRGMPVPVKYSISVRFGDIRFPENKKPLIMVDGKEIDMDAFGKVDRNIIESVSILKDSASISIYGQRGANGVILVNTKRDGTASHDKEVVAFTEKVVSETDAVLDFSVTGTVVDEQGRPKAGVSVVVPHTAIGTMTDANGRFSLKTPKQGSIWFSFVGYKTVKVPVSSEMSIRLEQEVVELFPEMSGSLKIRSASFSSGTKGLVNGLTVHGIKDGEQPLIIIDGKETLEADALSKLSPDRIKSVSVLKDKSAIAVYGEKGKDGVILVDLLTEKEYQNKLKLPKPAKIETGGESSKKGHFFMGGAHDAEWHTAQAKKALLIVIDGKEALEADALSKLSPDRIKSFSVLKDESAIAAYGEKGKNGVVMITLLTDAEYDFNKANTKKSYADALELAESLAKDIEGKIVYYINDEEIKKSKLKGMSIEAIQSVSVNDVDGVKIVRLKTDKYRSDWIPVTGIVTDKAGKPIVATVVVKGTDDHTVADSWGHFHLIAPKNGVLRVGGANKTVAEVKVKPTLNIVLKDK